MTHYAILVVTQLTARGDNGVTVVATRTGATDAMSLAFDTRPDVAPPLGARLEIHVEVPA